MIGGIAYDRRDRLCRILQSTTITTCMYICILYTQSISTNEATCTYM